MYTFHKNERLCSKKYLDNLFATGHRFMVFPYSVTWSFCDKEAIPCEAQVLIATSKRKFRHAVDRNHVKRLTRECYRLHKPELYNLLNNNNKKILLSINYIHTEILDYRVLYKKFDKIIDHLQKDLSA